MAKQALCVAEQEERYRNKYDSFQRERENPEFVAKLDRHSTGEILSSGQKITMTAMVKQHRTLKVDRLINE